MKKIILFIAVFVSISQINAQSFVLYFEGQPLGQNAEITLTSHADSGMMVLDTLDVKNISDVTAEVFCSRTIIENIEGTVNSFCWGVCYPPFIDTSSVAVTILPLASSFEFVGDHDPNGLVGVVKVKYTFYDSHNASNQATVFVNYDATHTGGIADVLPGYSMTEAYPNPANNIASIDYDFNGHKNCSIVIYNLLGSVVEKMDVSGKAGTAKFNTSLYNEGIYFYSLLINNEVISTHKMIIRH
jgi:hypothetical protein